MTWGELKTAWYTSLGEYKDSVYDFEFGFYMDQAQTFLTSILPARMVPEMITTEKQATNAFGAALNNCPMAFLVQCLDILSVRVDPVNIGATHLEPIYHSAREVSPSEFFATKDLTDEIIYTVNNGYILLSHAQGTPASSEKMNQVTYKRIPQKYEDYGTYYGSTNKTLVSVGKVDAGDTTKILMGHADTTQANYQSFADAGVDPGVFVGGWMIGLELSGGTLPSYSAIGEFYPIVDAYDEFIDPDYFGRVVVDGALHTYINYEFVLIAPPSAGRSVSADSAAPELNERWHELMLAIALSKVFLKLGDKDKAGIYSNMVREGLQAVGITLEETA